VKIIQSFKEKKAGSDNNTELTEFYSTGIIL